MSKTKNLKGDVSPLTSIDLLDCAAKESHNAANKRKECRRQIERRAPKRGVNVRHDDDEHYTPKRIRRGKAI